MEPKEYFLIVGIIILCFFGIPFRIPDPSIRDDEKLFKDYIKRFNKTDIKTHSEYLIKFDNFKKSLRLIEELNKNRTNNESAIYGLTEFSDLSQDEFAKTKLLLKPKLKYSKYEHNTRIKRSLSLPLKVDWRDKGVIGKVNNQKTCGACWAFSVVETIESMNAIRGGSLIQLSVQEVIDCARFGNHGCDGGDSCSLLDWLFETKTKITTEKLYPFMYTTGVCKINKPKTGVQIKNFSCANFAGYEELLLEKLAFHGPVSAAVNAINWQYYLGGIIQYHCSGRQYDLNHAVQIVGYDRTGSVPYYIAKNSWGSEFGDGGYIYIAIGGNLCGLANEVTFMDVL